MSWNDFNDAEDQNDFDVIPNGTPVKVRMTVKPGGYDDPSQGLTGGFATRSNETGSVYLNCEFMILEGKYAKRKVWSLIGLHSNAGPKWRNQGRAFIKGILNSARNIDPKDESPKAKQARNIQGLHELDGIEFAAKVRAKRDDYDGLMKNTIEVALTPDKPQYKEVMFAQGMAPVNATYPPQHASTAPSMASGHLGATHVPPQQQAPVQQGYHAQQPVQDAPQGQPNDGRPSWAN